MSESAQRPLEAARPAGNSGLKLVGLAVLASLVASTCCVLPLVLVLVGITGAWMSHLAVLKPVTPVFIAIALGTLAWAGYLIFRPRAACSMDGQACEQVRPLTRRIFIACALFIVLLLSFPLFAPLFY